MANLREQVAATDKRKEIIDDCCQVLDAEVADKRGISGMAVKTAYKVVKGIQPGFIPKFIDYFLDEFLNALDPLYQEALEKKVSPKSHFMANPGRVAESLLAITDALAVNAKNKLLQKTYNKLRSSAKDHVMAGVPRLASLLEKYAPAE